jgi:hypothetical protein
VVVARKRSLAIANVRRKLVVVPCANVDANKLVPSVKFANVSAIEVVGNAMREGRNFPVK